MSNVDRYAASVVDEYHVAADTESPSHRVADELVPLIKQWGKQYLQGITLSGAYAKNTAVSLCSDVDVLIALKPVPGKEMKNIFWSLFEFLGPRCAGADADGFDAGQSSWHESGPDSGVPRAR